MIKVLLLFLRVVAEPRDNKVNEITSLQFMECVQPSCIVNDALGCKCLRWASAEGAVKETDLDRVGERPNVLLREIGLKWFLLRVL